MKIVSLCTIFLINIDIGEGWRFSSRRSFFTQCLIGLTTSQTPTLVAAVDDTSLSIQHPFRYSEQWTGTALPWIDLGTAVDQAKNTIHQWNMGRWPDPMLRRSAEPVDKNLWGTEDLQMACEFLQNTARANKAVGLAAQQCGINARIIFLELEHVAWNRQKQGVSMINPKISARSPEDEMMVCRERCLVLPPTFVATVLRDAWIDVEYLDWTGKQHSMRLRGETARACQHEMDHDRGKKNFHAKILSLSCIYATYYLLSVEQVY
jgi:peptide deformylase